ncbi:MAG: hypothetical protein ACRC2T_20080, partial [Thermoguttaceae bacterium]
MDTFLRQTPFKMLHWLLPRMGVNLAVDWTKLHAYDLGKIRAEYHTQPDDIKLQAEATAREIAALADQQGIAAMKEAAEIYNDKVFLHYIKSYPNKYMLAVVAWSQHQRIYEKAKTLLELNRTSFGKKRTGLPLVSPEFSDEKLDTLKHNLQEYFLSKQNRGKVCTVELLERSVGVFTVFAYCDDYERATLYHNEQELLLAKLETPVFELVFSLDANEG